MCSSWYSPVRTLHVQGPCTLLLGACEQACMSVLTESSSLLQPQWVWGICAHAGACGRGRGPRSMSREAACPPRSEGSAWPHLSGREKQSTLCSCPVLQRTRLKICPSHSQRGLGEQKASLSPQVPVLLWQDCPVCLLGGCGSEPLTLSLTFHCAPDGRPTKEGTAACVSSGTWTGQFQPAGQCRAEQHHLLCWPRGLPWGLHHGRPGTRLLPHAAEQPAEGLMWQRSL